MDQVKEVTMRVLSEKEEEQLIETIFNMLVGLDDGIALRIVALVESAIGSNLIVAPQSKDRLHRDGENDHT